MGFYQDRILPYLIDRSMRKSDFAEYRTRVIRAAKGRVLEVGIGSGLNLSLYPPRVERVIGLDPSPRLLAMALRTVKTATVPVELLVASAERIPLANDSVDTVVTTWTLCSIPDASLALLEMRRVLKSGGRLLFVEHGRSPDARVQWWQDRLTPPWRRIGGGCHLNRAIDEMIEGAGFRIEQLKTGYMKGTKSMIFMYEGSASPLC